MARDREIGRRVLWGRGSPYGPFVLLALCLVGTVLVLWSAQPRSRPVAASLTADTVPVIEKRQLSPSAAQLPRAARAATLKPEPQRQSRPTAPPASPAIAKPSPPSSGPSAADIEQEIIRLTNAERAAEGLRPLTHDTALDAIARAHSRDMVKRGFFSHENPEGDGPTERAEKAGYNVHKVVPGGELVGLGENIGSVPLGEVEDIGRVEREARSIAAAQVRGWMSRRSHRSNILSEDYERIGAGVVYDGKGTYTCTQVFW